MRRGLLDALAALEKHLDALVLVGAQAINIHTDENDEPIAIETKDSDLVVERPRAAARLDTRHAFRQPS